jgi:hypothetical protein
VEARSVKYLGPLAGASEAVWCGSSEWRQLLVSCLNGHPQTATWCKTGRLSFYTTTTTTTSSSSSFSSCSPQAPKGNERYDTAVTASTHARSAFSGPPTNTLSDLVRRQHGELTDGEGNKGRERRG